MFWIVLQMMYFILEVFFMFLSPLLGVLCGCVNIMFLEYLAEKIDKKYLILSVVQMALCVLLLIMIIL